MSDSIADLERKVALLTSELEEARQQQAAAADVLRVISGSDFDLDSVLTALTQSAISLCRATRGVIWLRRDGQLFLAAHVNYSDEWVAFARGNPITPAADAVTTSGLAAFTGEIVHVEDVLTDPRFRSLAAHRLGDYRAGIAVPLKRGDQVVGVISLSRPEARLFSDEQVRLIETFASQAVIAIENARLLRELRARTGALTQSLEQQTASSEILRAISTSPTDTQPVFDTIVRNAVALCDSLFANVFRFDGELLHITASNNSAPGYGELLKTKYPMRPDDTQISGRVLLTKSVVRMEDALADPAYDKRFTEKGWRRMLGVPMLRDGEPLGVIVVGWADPGPVPKALEDLLNVFADQAVIAIENVRLFEEVQARNRELAESLEQQVATSAILRAIAGSPTDIQPVLNAVVKSAAQLCDGYDTTIFLRRGNALAVAAHLGRIRVDFDELPMRRDIVTSRAVLDRMPVHVHDLAADGSEYPTGQKLARQMGFRTVLSTPLLREGEGIGAIMIRRTEVRPFSDRQVELLKTFADQAVIAIENVRLFEEVQARNRELTESLERQTAMSDILRVISRSPTDVRPVFETIAESAARLCSAHYCTVFRFDGELIHFAAQHGLSPEAIDAQRRAFPMPPGPGSGASRAILNAAVEQIPDVNADPDYLIGETARAIGARSVLAVPILRDGRPVGSINIGRPEPGKFPLRQIELLQTFADQAVIAIENVRLFEQVQARTAELTEALQQQTATADVLKVISRSAFDLDTVMKTLIETGIELCEASRGAIWLRKGDQFHLVAHVGTNDQWVALAQSNPLVARADADTVAGLALFTGEIVHVEDIPSDPRFRSVEMHKHGGYRTGLAVPLKREGKIEGVFGLSRNERRLYTDRQVALIQTFADQAVIAIENVRLFDEVQARTAEVSEALQQQTATADVLKVISRSAFDLQAVLQALVDSAVRLCGADMGAITMREGDSLRFKAGSGQSPELRSYEMAHPHPLGRGTFQGRAAVEKATIHVPDVSQDAEYVRPEAAAIGQFRAILSVPLRRGDEVVGVFGLARRVAGPFSERQIELVETFADQAVIAIENVRLFEEVQARTAELSEALEQQTATSEILRVISTSPTDVQPVLDAVGANAARLCEANNAVIFRLEGDLLHQVASYGQLSTSSHPSAGLPVSRDTVTGRAVFDRRSIHIRDLASADADFPLGSQHARRDGHRTTLATPLLREDVPVGAILIRRMEVRPFSEKQIQLLETFADQAAIAIENVRLFDEVQARTANLSEALQQQTATAEVLKVISRSAFDVQLVLDTLAESAARLCEADIVDFYRSANDGFQWAASFGANSEGDRDHTMIMRQPGRGSVSGRVLLDRKTVHVPDFEADPEFTFVDVARKRGIRAILGVPLLRGDSLIGLMLVMRRAAGPFSTKQTELAETFADQAVIAIENVRLFDEVQAKTRDLEEALKFQKATGDVLEVIGRSASTLEPVLQAIVDTAADLCRADMSVVRLLRDGALHYAASSKRNDPAIVSHSQEHPIMPTDRSSVAGRVALEGRTIHISDITVDPEYSYLSGLVGTEIRSILGVPLFHDGKVVGVIALLRRAIDPFTERQIDLVQTFADQAVIAIENARLFQAVQHRTEELSRSLDELQTAQDRLIQTEKLASLGQLTAGIAHEIKNPLNFVNNFSSLSAELIGELEELLQRLAIDQDTKVEVDEISTMLKGNLEKVVQHGKRADSIVKNMLLHSRQGSGEHRPSDINAIVEESLNLAYHGARAEKKGFNITFQKSLDPTAGEVDVFPQEITRVLINLITNSFYATLKRAGEADGVRYEPLLAATTRNLGDSVEIRIRDNGTGIPPHVVEKMFNPFFTTKPAGEGTGLGLSLSHDIVVKQHAGTIDVSTEPGSFTEFRIVLPRSAATLGQSGGSS